MKKIIFLSTCILYLIVPYAFSAVQSINCDSISGSTASCDECFREENPLYTCNEANQSCTNKEGITLMSDIVANTATSGNKIMYDNDEGQIFTYPLQGTIWSKSAPQLLDMFQFPAAYIAGRENFTTGPAAAWSTVSNAYIGYKLAPGASVKWIEFKPNQWLRPDKALSTASRTLPALRTEFIPRLYTSATTYIDHKQCVYYYVRWCGDGVLDTDKGEQCDNGTANGTPGNACNATCQNVVTQPAVCQSLTLTPSTALINTPINYTCTATNATSTTTYNITKNDVSVGTLPIDTLQFSTAGTYTIKCIVNGNTPTPAACIKTVTITSPPVPTIPSIFIDKDDSTPGTPDSDGNDIQKVQNNGTATFTVRFVNNGNEALKNVVIEDPLASDCNRNSTQTALLYAGGASSNFDIGETFSYTCTKTNVTSSTFPNDRNTVTIKGVGVTSGQNVTDSDITEIFIEEQVNPRITIEKNDTDNLDDEQELDEGDAAKFSVKVTNNGDESLENLEITDELSPDCDRSISETKDLIRNIGNRDSVFDPGEKFAYTCKETSVDSDTFPDEINTICVEANGTESDDNVEDCDDTEILLNTVDEETNLMCYGIESSEGTFGGAPFRTTISCDVEEESSCIIEVTRDGEVIHEYNSCTKTITLADTGDYAIACIVDDERTEDCEMELTVEAMTDIPTGTKLLLIAFLSLMLAAVGTHIYKKRSV